MPPAPTSSSTVTTTITNASLPRILTALLIPSAGSANSWWEREEKAREGFEVRFPPAKYAATPRSASCKLISSRRATNGSSSPWPAANSLTQEAEPATESSRNRRARRFTGRPVGPLPAAFSRLPPQHGSWIYHLTHDARGAGETGSGEFVTAAAISGGAGIALSRGDRADGKERRAVCDLRGFCLA